MQRTINRHQIYIGKSIRNVDRAAPPFSYHSQLKLCDPQSQWQRASNENTNGLIRQYFPKKICLAHYIQQDLDQVAEQLNCRPRKTLRFKTPKEIIGKDVSLTDCIYSGFHPVIALPGGASPEHQARMRQAQRPGDIALRSVPQTALLVQALHAAFFPAPLAVYTGTVRLRYCSSLYKATA